jgi:hypothetical protein
MSNQQHYTTTKRNHASRPHPPSSIRSTIDKLQFSERFINQPKKWFPEQEKFMKSLQYNDDIFKLQIRNQQQWLNTFSDLKLIKSFIIKARREYNQYIKNAIEVQHLTGYIKLPVYSPPKPGTSTTQPNYNNAALYFDRKIPLEFTDKDGFIRHYHNTFGKTLPLTHFTPLYPYVEDQNYWTNEKLWYYFYSCPIKLDISNPDVIKTFIKLGQECIKSKIRVANLNNDPIEELNKELEEFPTKPIEFIVNGNPDWFKYSIHKPVQRSQPVVKSIPHLLELIITKKIEEADSYLKSIGYRFSFASRFGTGIFKEEFTVSRAIQIVAIEIFKTFNESAYAINLLTRLSDFKKIIQQPCVKPELPYIREQFMNYYEGHDKKIRGSNLREAKTFNDIISILQPFSPSNGSSNDSLAEKQGEYHFQTNKHIYVYTKIKIDVPTVKLEDNSPMFINILV